MALTNSGRDFIRNAICNNGPPIFFTAANARIAVGNSNTAFSASQTDLLGASTLRKVMDAGFPDFTQGANIIRFQSTFATGDANFDWLEWGVVNSGSGGTLLNRKQEGLGTKTSAQTWQFTVDLTVNNP
jgi:hypothetical protein